MQVYTTPAPSWATLNLVECYGPGATNTVGRAELGAIAATVTHEHSHIATDRLASLHQIGNNCCTQSHHVHGDILKILSFTTRTSQSHIFLIIKSYPGIVGNECADGLAKCQACHKDILPAETTMCTAGPGGNPFFDVSWLALE